MMFYGYGKETLTTIHDDSKLIIMQFENMLLQDQILFDCMNGLKFPGSTTEMIKLKSRQKGKGGHIKLFSKLENFKNKFISRQGWT